MPPGCKRRISTGWTIVELTLEVFYFVYVGDGADEAGVVVGAVLARNVVVDVVFNEVNIEVVVQGRGG